MRVATEVRDSVGVVWHLHADGYWRAESVPDPLGADRLRDMRGPLTETAWMETDPQPAPPQPDAVFEMWAEAEADVVSAGDVCGARVEWQPDPERAPAYWRAGYCTFAKGHPDGEHSRP